MTALRTLVLTAAAALAVAACRHAAERRPIRQTPVANTTPLTIPATGTSGPATPYPSPVTVEGLKGPVTDVDVVLHGVGHDDPLDIRAVLVSPSGATVALMDGNCGNTPAEDLELTLDQSAPTDMPTATACTSTTYRPAASTDNRPMPAPAPQPPHAISLDVLDGTNPDGTWKLFVTDTKTGGVGDMEGGWTLNLKTATAEVSVPGAGTSGAGDPFPAAVDVMGESGVVSDVNVSVGALWHSRPDDLDLLLVGPQGQRSLLMSDACGEADVQDISWTWDDEAAAPMADLGPCPRGAYRPTDVESGDAFPPPAPAGPYPASLAGFDGTDPNGAWQFYAVDDTVGDTGFLSGLSVDVTTRPAASVTFTEPAVRIAEGQRRTLTLRRVAQGGAALGAGSVHVRTVAGSARSGPDFTPVDQTVDFAAGQAERAVTVDARSDGVAEPAETYAVTLAAATGDATAGGRAAVTIAPSAGPVPRGGGGATPSRPRCGGRPATIIGTAGHDVLRGTSGRDVIAAGGGNDVVRAGDRSDVVCGGTGDDRIAGDSGADRLSGGSGSDHLTGGSGADRLSGGAGADLLAGDAGRTTSPATRAPIASRGARRPGPPLGRRSPRSLRRRCRP